MALPGTLARCARGTSGDRCKSIYSFAGQASPTGLRATKPRILAFLLRRPQSNHVVQRIPDAGCDDNRFVINEDAVYRFAR